MRAVVQRVRHAKVTVDQEVVGEIQRGLLVLLGVGRDDQESDAAFLSDKIYGLRIFEDDDGKMNRSLQDFPDHAVLAVSQFTLFGDCRKGRRPSFVDAAPPELAERLYNSFVQALVRLGARVATGRFRAQMMVELVNDGPVTLILDTKSLKE